MSRTTRTTPQGAAPDGKARSHSNPYWYECLHRERRRWRRVVKHALQIGQDPEPRQIWKDTP